MLGRSTGRKEHFQKAVQLNRESARIFGLNRGEDHTNTLESNYALVQAQIELGELDQALPLLKILVDKLQRLRDPNDPMALNATNMLGWTYMHKGQFSEAEYVLNGVFQFLRHKRPRDLLTIQVMGNLAIVQFRLGKLEKAALLDKQTEKLATEVLGSDHPETLAAKARLGLGYLNQQRYAEAKKLLQQVADVGPEIPGIENVRDAIQQINDESKMPNQESE